MQRLFILALEFLQYHLQNINKFILIKIIYEDHVQQIEDTTPISGVDAEMILCNSNFI